MRKSGSGLKVQSLKQIADAKRVSMSLNQNLSQSSGGSFKFKRADRSFIGSGSTHHRRTAVKEVARDPDRPSSGASFAESQLPSSGSLTVEADRTVIKEIEEKVIHHARRTRYLSFSTLSTLNISKLTPTHVNR
jgi:hypothetical protein